MPNALLSEAESRASSTLGSATSTFSSVTSPVFTPATVAMPVIPVGCSDAACGKGAPAPVSPTLTVVAAATLVGVLALAAASRRVRRLRSAVATLPRGSAFGLFHPPQFS